MESTCLNPAVFDYSCYRDSTSLGSPMSEKKSSEFPYSPAENPYVDNIIQSWNLSWDSVALMNAGAGLDVDMEQYPAYPMFDTASLSSEDSSYLNQNDSASTSESSVDEEPTSRKSSSGSFIAPTPQCFRVSMSEAIVKSPITETISQSSPPSRRHPLLADDQIYHPLINPKPGFLYHSETHNSAPNVTLDSPIASKPLTIKVFTPAKRRLACLFCRNRKISCTGRSPDDKSDPVPCTQCQRRNICCKYPERMRHGQRKKGKSLKHQ